MTQQPLFKISEIAPKSNGASARTVKSNRQLKKLAKVNDSLNTAIGKLEQGTDIHYATGAMWSMHELAVYILDQIGPAHLIAATWSMSSTALEVLSTAALKKDILSTAFLVDWRVRVRCPEALAFVKRFDGEIRVSTCHAKVTVLMNDKWAISVVGSANFTNNPRIEAGVLSTSREIAEFHRGWITAEIDNGEPFAQDMSRAKKCNR